MIDYDEAIKFKYILLSLHQGLRLAEICRIDSDKIYFKWVYYKSTNDKLNHIFHIDKNSCINYILAGSDDVDDFVEYYI